MPLSIKEKQQPYLRRPVIRFYGCRRIAPTSIRLNTVGLGLRTLDEGIVSSVLMSYLHKDWVAKIKFIGYILPAYVSCIFIRQAEALGLGHAVLCARPAVGNEPFAVILADDLIDAPQGALKQMVDIYNQSGNSVLGVETIDPFQTGSYGIVEVEQLKHYQRIINIVEKPKPEEAPSNLAVVGRYILTPRIFDLLTNLPRGAGGEIQLTDGIARLLDHEFVLAHAFEGKRYDCGSKLGYLEATIAYGLKHAELKEEFKKLLQQFV